jgi:hypothetical protein
VPIPHQRGKQDLTDEPCSSSEHNAHGFLPYGTNGCCTSAPATCFTPIAIFPGRTTRLTFIDTLRVLALFRPVQEFRWRIDPVLKNDVIDDLSTTRAT